MDSEQLGTGHAVQQATPYINDDSISLVLYGDVPLIRQSTFCEQSACACISTCSSKVLSDRTCKTFGLVEFILIGEINYITINAIEDAKPYLGNSWYEKKGDRIDLKPSWCKGGRARSIDVKTQEQRQLLDKSVCSWHYILLIDFLRQPT
jgi:hypothetical protein